MSLLTFSVDVAVSDHDSLRLGRLATSVVSVDVLADTDTDALLAACQLAARHGMPTSATITGVVA